MPPKDKKKRRKQKDTDPTDEQGGGGDVLTEKGFLEALDKVINTKKQKSERKLPDRGKSKTSE
jgi:hypothetical protein